MGKTYPLREVIYSALKPDTNGRWFILLECGHIEYHGWKKKPPKRVHCHSCAWGVITVDLIFWDWNEIRWERKTKTRPMMETKNV